jgi:hypothetical protein
MWADPEDDEVTNTHIYSDVYIRGGRRGGDGIWDMGYGIWDIWR